MKRREFIILTTAGATTAALLSACGHPENKLIPVFIPDDEYVPGLDYWKATTCHMCEAGCGILVRTREHKANKIEGNPLHPGNRGALCARGQAGLQVHYNPDRIRGPKKRTGDRGSGEFADISWEEAIKTLADILKDIKSRADSPTILLAAHSSRGVTGLAAEHLMASVGSMRLAVDQYPGEQVEAAGYLESYGTRSRPVFDIGNARYLLSFGARFLETWHSPVMYSLGYAQFRRSTWGGRGRFVQVEPRMSMTAANADEWLPVAPGTEALVALGIAQVIVAEGLVPNASPPAFLEEPLDNFAPDKTIGQTGLPTERIKKVAREFARARGLAIAGGTILSVADTSGSLRAINFLNSLVDNINKRGGVLLGPEAEFDPFSRLRAATPVKWQPLSEQLDSGSTPAAILFHKTNPLFTSPWLADRIKAVPFIASFSSFVDETTMLADLILPDNSNFESWDLDASLSLEAGEAVGSETAMTEAGTAEAGRVEAIGARPLLVGESLPPGRKAEGPDSHPTAPGLILAVTLSRPVLSTEYDTRQTADVFIAVGKELGADMARTLPFGSAEEIVKAAAAELQKLPGQVLEPTWQPKADAESQQEGDMGSQFWDKFFEAGVWTARPGSSGKAGQSTRVAERPAPSSRPVMAPEQTAAQPPERGERVAPGKAEPYRTAGAGAARKSYAQYPAGGGAAGKAYPQYPAADGAAGESSSQYPLTFLAYEHPVLGFGAEANLPWLQELAEPMTTVMWGSWVEINPKTASALSIEDGDLVEVRSSSGSVRAPALIYPAIHPDAVAMPYGQGHSAYGMYARARGANAAELCPLLSREEGRPETIRVSISRVSGEARLIRFGTMLGERPERHR